jgi:hypothetical protein
VATHASAQARPDATEELRLFESTERGLDPLGLDESTGKGLDEAARRLAAARAKASPAPLPTPSRGEVLSSIEGVTESVHEVALKLEQGLAFVRVRMRFESRATLPAELAYRLPLPPDAAVSALRACQASRCVDARAFAREQGVDARERGVDAREQGGSARPGPRAPRADAKSGAPAPAAAGTNAGGGGLQAGGPELSATRISDARGSALALRAASVAKDAPLTIELEYVASAELRGGVARFRLPARGYDPRAAPARIALSAPGLSKLEPAAELTLDPWLPLAVRAELAEHPGRSALTTSARCGGSACARSFEASTAAPPSPRETWLLLDASPSMEGPARNRADLALAGLLAGLPEATPLRAFAFAARGQELSRSPAGSASLAMLSDALSAKLGAASRPGALLDLAKHELERARPRLVVVSDAKLDAAALRELRVLRERGAELWLIDVGGARPELRQVFEGVVSLARDAEAPGNGDLAPLEEALRPLLGPRAGAGRRRGEQYVLERRPPAPYVPRPGEPWLSFWLARATPLAFRSTTRAAERFIPSLPFEGLPAREQAPDTGMPRQSVLSMLRDQLVPQARGCLRTDRKGRADYAVSLIFHALFAEREAYDVRIEGKIPEPLRQCLAVVVQDLRIPSFSGRICVRYPIHTEREPEAPVVELEPEAAEQVERVIRAR